MSQASSPVESRDESGGIVGTVGVWLSPAAALSSVVAAVLTGVTVSKVASYASYPRYSFGITEQARHLSIVFCILVGLAGPSVIAFLWFDVIRSTISRRSRLALVGYLGTTVSLLAIATLIAAPKLRPYI